MKITWHPNPLRTVVELDEQEKRELRHKIEIEEFRGRLGMARAALESKANPDRSSEERISNAMAYIDPESLYDDAKMGALIDEQFRYSLEALSDEHAGDCTCQPSSCTKCHAEELVGADTIRDLGKHPGAKIAGAFRGDKTLDEALAILRDYDPGPRPDTWKREDYEIHIPRWKAEAKRAHDWLLAYKREHFNGDPK